MFLATKKKTTNKIDFDEAPNVFKCTRCGATFDLQTGHFYKTPSELYKNNNGYYPVCISCLKERLKELSNRYGERRAITVLCHYLDIPFYYSLYDSMIKKTDNFSIGTYVRQMNNRQYSNKTFVNTLNDLKELSIDAEKFEEIKEEKWKASEHRNKNNVIEIIGYDPFEGYNENQRRFLFNDIINYLQEDGIEDDTYKISQITQLVNNNYQISELNREINNLNPVANMDDYESLSGIKKQLVDSNNKIAKENGISVINRKDQTAGRSTLTYHMKYMRQLGIEEAEANYYDQLKSEGTQWAATMSLKAIRENGFFDENDSHDITEYQYNLIQKLQAQVDDLEEEKRLLIIENDNLKAGVDDGK